FPGRGVFARIHDQLVEDQSYPHGPIGRHQDACGSSKVQVAGDQLGLHIPADATEVDCKFDVGNVGAVSEPLMCLCDNPYPARRLLQDILGVTFSSGTEVDQGGHELKTILHSVVYLVDKDLVVIECSLQCSLAALPLNRHAEDIGGALKKGD